MQGPRLVSSENVFALKTQQYRGPVATGCLSSGKGYEIKLVRRSAVKDGVHLILHFPRGGEPSAQEEAESLGIFLQFARTLPCVDDHGLRLGLNVGGMRNQSVWHAHIMIPGSDIEHQNAPRLTDPWEGELESVSERLPNSEPSTRVPQV